MDRQHFPEAVHGAFEGNDDVTAERIQAMNSRLRQEVDELQSTVRGRTFVFVAIVLGLLAFFPYLGREHGRQTAERLAEFEDDFVKMGYGISLATRREHTQAYELTEVKCLMARKPIWGVAVLPGQLFVLHEKSTEVEVYNTETFNHTYEMSLEVDGLVEPMDMVASAELVNVFISDWKKSSVFRIDSDGDVTYWSVGDQPHGLAVDSENNVLVTCPVRGVVKVFTPRGRLVRQIKLQPDIINPWHAIPISNELLAVTHGTKTDEVNRVCIVDMTSGKTLKCLQRFLVPLSSPIRLASVDEYVIVADENNRRLLMLTDGLEYVWTLATELRGAMRLASTVDTQEKRRLYVAVNTWKGDAFVRGEIKLYVLI